MYLRRIIIVSIVILLYSSIAFTQTHTSPNYTLITPRIVVSAGNANSAGYSLTNVEIGSTFGGKAESAAYTLCAGFIIGVAGEPSIYVGPLEPIGWQIEEPVKAGHTYLARVLVRNIGDVRVDLSLRVEDKTDGKKEWQAGRETGANDVNTYVMSAIITGINVANVEDSYFNENGDEDIMWELPKPSDANTFAYSQSSQNGMDIAPHEERYFWLKFDAPRVDTTSENQHEAHFIYVEVKTDR